MGLRDQDWVIKKIIEHEGFRVEPYTDTQGYITGGIGHKFTDRDFKEWDPNWSREEKTNYWQKRFEEDLLKAEGDAAAVAEQYGIEPTDKNMYVLMDMAFNLGPKGLRGFRNFLSDMGKGNVEDAILEMKQKSKSDPAPSKWYKQVPNRVDSLIEILRSSK